MCPVIDWHHQPLPFGCPVKAQGLAATLTSKTSNQLSSHFLSHALKSYAIFAPLEPRLGWTVGPPGTCWYCPHTSLYEQLPFLACTDPPRALTVWSPHVETVRRASFT